MSELQVPTLAEFVRLRRMRPTWSAPTGMSRQQLAAAIHSSIGYIAKIEQGDAHSPSPGVLDALVDVLGLDADERIHLYRLAHRTPQEEETDIIPATLQPTLDALAPHPAAALGAYSELLACNSACDAAFPGIRASGSTLRWLFTNPYARLVVEEWEREAGLAVGRLRHCAGTAEAPESLRRLLDELGDEPDFRRLWTSQRVMTHRPDSTMRLRDPRTGVVRIIRIEELSTTGQRRHLLLLGLPTDADVA
ncbi:helix-turn-helix domain-containing protein [Nocardia sp. 004]|uniref:MmyB family transcriptional regulator n=1 Tax=Nocardia sp. 004 TaxID=3385978 RepID=UPI0039A0E214